jgi:hypothetical protein
MKLCNDNDQTARATWRFQPILAYYQRLNV